MFPFRPSRAATALLELAEAMLAPDAFEHTPAEASPVEARTSEAQRHPHRRPPAVERRRRPAPPTPEQACLTPLTRAGRTRAADALRS
jgi:hypothetical protein